MEAALTILLALSAPSDFPLMEQSTAHRQVAVNGWERLFDGKSLAGWRVEAKPADRGKTFWTVVDGTIQCDSMGRPDHDHVWLVSEREFGDFELRLQVRGFIDSPGNSGVQVRSRYDQEMGWLHGPQVDVHPPAPWRTGLIYDETWETRRWIHPSLKDWNIAPEQGPKQCVSPPRDTHRVLLAHRQRPDVHLQLAVCPPARRDDDPADRRHGRRAQHASLAGFHLRRPALAGSGLGRAVPAVRTAGAAPAMAEAIFAKGMAYRDFTPQEEEAEKARVRRGSLAVQPRACASCREERPPRRRGRAVRASLPRAARGRARGDFDDEVYGEQAKSTADIEDFALLRSDGMPTYHMASCADDADLRISHIIRGQDHLTNTFKHVLIFEALGRRRRFAHLPLLMAPDGRSSRSASTVRW
jgi:hypothetical protein